MEKDSKMPETAAKEIEEESEQVENASEKS